VVYPRPEPSGVGRHKPNVAPMARWGHTNGMNPT
jgi:hypothetical protein